MVVRQDHLVAVERHKLVQLVLILSFLLLLLMVVVAVHQMVRRDLLVALAVEVLKPMLVAQVQQDKALRVVMVVILHLAMVAAAVVVHLLLVELELLLVARLVVMVRHLPIVVQA